MCCPALRSVFCSLSCPFVYHGRLCCPTCLLCPMWPPGVGAAARIPAACHREQGPLPGSRRRVTGSRGRCQDPGGVSQGAGPLPGSRRRVTGSRGRCQDPSGVSQGSGAAARIPSVTGSRGHCQDPQCHREQGPLPGSPVSQGAGTAAKIPAACHREQGPLPGSRRRVTGIRGRCQDPQCHREQGPLPGSPVSQGAGAAARIPCVTGSRGRC